MAKTNQGLHQTLAYPPQEEAPHRQSRREGGYRFMSVPPSASEIMIANGQLSTDSFGAGPVTNYRTGLQAPSNRRLPTERPPWIRRRAPTYQSPALQRFRHASGQVLDSGPCDLNPPSSQGNGCPANDQTHQIMAPVPSCSPLVSRVTSLPTHLRGYLIGHTTCEGSSEHSNSDHDSLTNI